MTEFDSVIPPGGVGKVTASLDTAHYRGAISKTIQVATSDPQARQILLELKAQVASPIDVAPSDTPLVTTGFGEAKPTELTLSATDGKPFDILAVQANPSVHVSVRGAPAAGPPGPAAATSNGSPVAGGSSRYRVTLTPGRDVPVGRSLATVTLTTSLEKEPTVLIHAILVVTGQLEVVPDQLWLEPGSTATPLHVRIRRLSGVGLKVLAVGSSDPDFSATATATAKGREYDIVVRYRGKPGRGPVSSRVTVTTNQPGQRAIIIPLAGQI